MQDGIRSRFHIDRQCVVPHRYDSVIIEPPFTDYSDMDHLQDPLSLSPTSSSSRSALNDSPVSDMNSKCDYAWSAVPRAETLGAIGSTECYLPPSDAEANAGEVAKAVSSQHFPSVPSPDPIGFVERSEQRPTHEVDLAWTLGPFDAMSVHQRVELSVCLRNGGMAKAQRRRPRAQALRVPRCSLELTNQELPPKMNALGLTS